MDTKDDIIDCIIKFDDTESLENKGRYFEVIQRDFKQAKEQESDIEEGCICQNCGEKYIMDVMVSSDLWEKIRPKGKDGESGLLCPVCIVKSIEEVEGFSAYKLVPIEEQKSITNLREELIKFNTYLNHEGYGIFEYEIDEYLKTKQL